MEQQFLTELPQLNIQNFTYHKLMNLSLLTVLWAVRVDYGTFQSNFCLGFGGLLLKQGRAAKSTIRKSVLLLSMILLLDSIHFCFPGFIFEPCTILR